MEGAIHSESRLPDLPEVAIHRESEVSAFSESPIHRESEVSALPESPIHRESEAPRRREAERWEEARRTSLKLPVTGAPLVAATLLSGLLAAVIVFSG